MSFTRIEPPSQLKHLVECYWIVEDDSTVPVEQKIIPDGFPEIIFHFKAPFLINMHKGWVQQSRSLFSGQIKSFFYLKNTGSTGVIGIKLKPAAPRRLFGLDMSLFNDQVTSLQAAAGNRLNQAELAAQLARQPADAIEFFNDFFSSTYRNMVLEDLVVDNAVDLILESNGAVTVKTLTEKFRVSERHLQRLFKAYIGLSPKFFCRIIRFSTIFRLKQENDPDWMTLSMESGFYDQSHFIRNFKAFTGEDPGRYDFKQENLANFFLKKAGS